MFREQVDKLLWEGEFPECSGERRLIETHISWVIIATKFVYKIKKPMKYSFLDFSTLENRKYYCEREIDLNNRLARGLYIDVLPIKEIDGGYSVGGEKGVVADYVVRMNRLDSDKQMDVLLKMDKVTSLDIINLARLISGFHSKATVVAKKDYLGIRGKFNALLDEKDFLEEKGVTAAALIQQAIEFSDAFIDGHKGLLKARLEAGLYRDGHGDLHTRNIFLLPEPVVFDCIEFNDEYREIDVLNEVAFLCMDLEALGRSDFSEQFINSYINLLPAMKTEEEKRLFVYYKSYRANVRAKVNSLRARGAVDEADRNVALNETAKYLELMNNYLTQL